MPASGPPGRLTPATVAGVSETTGERRTRRANGDSLPEELDVTAYVGPYLFPDTNRRRIAATIYAVLALACLLGSARVEQRRAAGRGHRSARSSARTTCAPAGR